MNSQILVKKLMVSILMCFAGLASIYLSEPQKLLSSYLVNFPLGIDALIWCICIALVSIACWVLSPRFAHVLLAGISLLYIISGIGFLPVFVFVLWLIGSTAAGISVLNLCITNHKFTKDSIPESFILGLALWIAISGVMIHFPVNVRWLYLSLSVAPILLLLLAKSDAKTILYELGSGALDAHARISSIPFWLWSVGLAIIGWVLRWASFPSVAYDDNAGRFRIFAELQHFQQAQFDVVNQIWSVAPFASDLLHATISNMVGSESRGAVNLALTIILLVILARLLRMVNISVSAKWVLVVLMASTPMLGNLLLSTQSELLLAVIVLLGLRLALDAREGIFGRHVLGVIACAAICAAIKLPGAVLGVTLLLCLALRLWDARAESPLMSVKMRWPAFIVLLLLAFVAFHSYVLAYVITGNPVFPLYNGIFKSPYFPPENFSDSTWIHGFTLWNYVRVFFETSAFFESGNYVAGWQYLFLLPVGLITFWKTDDAKLMKITLIPLLVFGLIMFAATQYWRYLFPIMPIAIFLMTPLFAFSNRYLQVAAFSAATLCILLNLLFYKNVSWMMASPAGVAYTQSGKDRYIELYAPVAGLTEVVNQIATGTRVLYPREAPYGAKLLGIPLYVNWYSPVRQSQFQMLSDRESISDFIRKQDVDFVITKSADAVGYHPINWVPTEIDAVMERRALFEVPDIRWTKVEPAHVEEPSVSPEDQLRQYLAEFGYVEGQIGPFILYSLREEPVPYRSAFDLNLFKQGAMDALDLFLPLTNKGVVATIQPEIMAILNPQDAHQVRYNVEFECSSDTGYFVAQINWDIGPPYYRLVPCTKMLVSFIETIPVPQNATKGLIYITVMDNTSAYVQNLKVDVH